MWATRGRTGSGKGRQDAWPRGQGYIWSDVHFFFKRRERTMLVRWEFFPGFKGRFVSLRYVSTMRRQERKETFVQQIIGYMGLIVLIILRKTTQIATKLELKL